MNKYKRRCEHQFSNYKTKNAPVKERFQFKI